MPGWIASIRPLARKLAAGEWFGFVACVALVLTAKALRRILRRPEDYYER